MYFCRSSPIALFKSYLCNNKNKIAQRQLQYINSCNLFMWIFLSIYIFNSIWNCHNWN
uniref:Uncharacterized protein n=1 Tax=Meloidogyne enterolobii TaxID=390850 RepID=A0A6V7UAQ4_MELEN|nr:unnamed protein product [Meloidogyne enterolobii]